MAAARPQQVPPASLVSGQVFRQAKVLGVVEADFFDWVVEVPGGERFVRSFNRRLSRFAWAHVEHDILKVLYESVIPAEQRKQLGEYYTPDCLAQHTMEETVESPLDSRVLDPSCGSGTFVFHAVKRYLEAVDRAEMENAAAITGVCTHVMGMDLHPVAVKLARVTCLLAIGNERLSAGRGRADLHPCLSGGIAFSGDKTLQPNGSLVVNADEDLGLFGNELLFPDRLLADASALDSSLPSSPSERPIVNQAHRSRAWISFTTVSRCRPRA